MNIVGYDRTLRKFRHIRMGSSVLALLTAGCAVSASETTNSETAEAALSVRAPAPPAQIPLAGFTDDIGTEADEATFAFDVGKAIATENPGDAVTAFIDGMKVIGDLGKSGADDTASQVAALQKSIQKLTLQIGAIEQQIQRVDAKVNHSLQFSLEISLEAARREILTDIDNLNVSAPYLGASEPGWVTLSVAKDANRLDQQILLFEQWLMQQPAPDLVQAADGWHRKVLASELLAIAVRLHYAAAGATVDANWFVARRDALARAYPYADGALATPWGIANARLRHLTDRSVNPYWSVRSAVDLSGDGYPDLVVHDASTGVVGIWEGGADYRIGNVFGQMTYLDNVPAADWSLRSVNDVNGDGYLDLVWTNETDNSVHAWLMHGTTRIGFVDNISRGWDAPLGDVDGDGRLDFFLPEYRTGTDAPASFDAQPPARSPFSILVQPSPSVPDSVTNPHFMHLGPSVGTDWSMKGVADFNGDGRSDVLWSQPNTGRAVVWMAPANARYYADAPGLGSYRYDDVQAVELAAVEDGGDILAIADFDRDGHPDVLAQRRDLGSFFIYFLNRTDLGRFGVVRKRPGIVLDW
jgi:hypothetical protein